MKNMFILFFMCPLVSLSSADLVLGWNQALVLLQKNNKDYHSAELTYRSTEILQDSADSGFLPSLSGAINYSQSQTEGVDDESRLYSGSLTLTQNLFAGFKDNFKSAEAKANSLAAAAAFQIAKAKIRNDFVTAYQNLLSASENLQLSDNIVTRRKQNLRLVELRFESGRENKGSVLLSEAYLAQAKYENLQALHAQQLAQVVLAQFLSLPTTQNLRLTDEVPLPRLENKYDFIELSRRTPTYKQILAQADARIAQVGVARSAFFPSLNLTGTLGRSSPEFFPQSSNKWSVGASITIPLFDGGRDYASLKSSIYTQQATAINRISVDQQQVELLQQAYQKYAQAIEKVKVDESFQKAAVVRSEIARHQYNNGLISFTEWDTVENDLILRQKNCISSKKDQVLSAAAWNKTLGEGVFP
ncbi:MAG: TolC family protein [Pseudobdellovibrionaceae bacterium]